jgi:hypothetical protein
MISTGQRGGVGEDEEDQPKKKLGKGRNCSLCAKKEEKKFGKNEQYVQKGKGWQENWRNNKGELAL